MSYSVNWRTQEIGLRMGLGAQRSHVLKMIVGQGMIMTLIGLVIGLGGAFALSRLLLASLLYEVSPTRSRRQRQSAGTRTPTG